MYKIYTRFITINVILSFLLKEYLKKKDKTLINLSVKSHDHSPS